MAAQAEGDQAFDSLSCLDMADFPDDFLNVFSGGVIRSASVNGE